MACHFLLFLLPFLVNLSKTLSTDRFFFMEAGVASYRLDGDNVRFGIILFSEKTVPFGCYPLFVFCFARFQFCSVFFRFVSYLLLLVYHYFSLILSFVLFLSYSVSRFSFHFAPDLFLRIVFFSSSLMPRFSLGRAFEGSRLLEGG